MQTKKKKRLLGHTILSQSFLIHFLYILRLEKKKYRQTVRFKLLGLKRETANTERRKGRGYSVAWGDGAGTVT